MPSYFSRFSRFSSPSENPVSNRSEVKEVQHSEVTQIMIIARQIYGSILDLHYKPQATETKALVNQRID